MQRKLWFKAKHYGWGWYPASWQGWAVILLYIAAVLTASFSVDETVSAGDFSLQFFPMMIALTIFLIVICYISGEAPRWRWGKEEEMIDVLNEQGEKTGKAATRSQIHKNGLRHRTSHVFIINSKKEVLLQLRSKEAASNPSMWHLSAGGHIATGQTSLDAAESETREEIGLSLSKSDFIYIGSAAGREDPSAPLRDNEFCDIFLVLKDVELSELQRQESEVADLRWISMQDFQQAIASRDPAFVPTMSTPVLFSYYNRYISHGAH